ncbi:MAG TPA: L-lactate permease [Anaerolineae bacterium]|nr:L-lactate permease [Anaerolineae bacterium]
MDILRLFLAASPILVVLYLMLGRGWGGSKAGPAGWLAAALVGWLGFGAGGMVLVVAVGRGLLLALFVLYIIWMALFLYEVTAAAGVIRRIGAELPKLVDDRAGQGLLLAWVFGSFLQGAAGFGVPAAVVAPLLVGLGMGAEVAVVVALLGHAWAVSFGSLGSSVAALVAATGMEAAVLVGPAAWLLGGACLGCGAGVLWWSGGWAGVRRRWLVWLVLGVVMGVVQGATAVIGLWNMAALAAALAGMVVAIIWFGWEGGQVDWGQLRPALGPYLLLIVIILAGETILADVLGVVVLNWEFPEVVTGQGWVTAGGAGRSINLFGHAGALLFYTSVVTLGWYRWRGALDDEGDLSWRGVVGRTVRGSRKSTVSIVALVVMAVTMGQAGMTQALAEGLSGTGAAFPFLSTFIGALGAFMTGSNTNSNVVFGALQMETAMAVGTAVPWILAAQTTGGAIGSMMAPAKIVVGCSTVAGAKEGVVLRWATVSGGVILVLVAVVMGVLF